MLDIALPHNAAREHDAGCCSARRACATIFFDFADEFCGSGVEVLTDVIRVGIEQRAMGGPVVCLNPTRFISDLIGDNAMDRQEQQAGEEQSAQSQAAQTSRRVFARRAVGLGSGAVIASLASRAAWGQQSGPAVGACISDPTWQSWTGGAAASHTGTIDTVEAWQDYAIDNDYKLTGDGCIVDPNLPSEQDSGLSASSSTTTNPGNAFGHANKPNGNNGRGNGW